MIAALQSIVMAAALVAAASVPTPAPFPVNPPAPQRGAHCPDGGGRAIGDAIGKGAYIRQEWQIASTRLDRHLIGYVYAGSDGYDYIDLTPAVPGERVRLLQKADLPRPGAFLRYCFSDVWTMPWKPKR